MHKKIFFSALVFCTYLCSMQQKEETSLNQFVKSTIIGSGTGLSEVFTGRPLDYFKTKIVTKKPISPNILEWYRGVGAHTVAIVPTTIIQTQLDSELQKALPETYSAPIAGALSGFFACLSDRIILEQQQNGKNVAITIQQLLAHKSFKNLCKGMPMVSIRELIFAAGYMQVMPTLSKALDEYTHSAFVKKAFAATTGGTVLALASHPCETIRLWQQTERGQTWTDVIRAMHKDKDGLFKNLFAGASYRTGRYALALLIMAEARSALTQHLQESAKQ